MTNTIISESASRAAGWLKHRPFVECKRLSIFGEEVNDTRPLSDEEIIQSAIDEATKEMRAESSRGWGRATSLESQLAIVAGQREDLRSEVERLRVEIQDVINQLEDTKRILADPIAVHLNLLRGTIARPSDRDLRHLLGGKYVLMESENEMLKSAISALNAELAKWESGPK